MSSAYRSNSLPPGECYSSQQALQQSISFDTLLLAPDILPNYRPALQGVTKCLHACNTRVRGHPGVLSASSTHRPSENAEEKIAPS